MTDKVRTALIFGVIIGVLITAATWAALMSGEAVRRFLDITSFAIVPVGVLLGQFYYRSRASGLVAYGDAYGVGFLSALIGAIVSAIGIYGIAAVDPGVTAEVLAQIEEGMRAQRIPKESREAVEAINQFMASPAGLAIASFISTLIIGALVALFTSVFTRKTS